MDFSEILEKTLREEGSWSNNANDAGGATMLGITQATLSSYRGRPVSEDEVHALTRDEAMEIYRKLYFDGPQINLLPEALQSPVFDWGVNAGPGRAIRGLQQLIDEAEVVPHISMDGGIGPATLNAVQKTLDAMGATVMVNAYQDERQKFYDEIVARKPSQAVFIKGWTNRTNRFRIP